MLSAVHEIVLFTAICKHRIVGLEILHVVLSRYIEAVHLHFQRRIEESIFFSCASAKAEHSLSSLSCVWMYVDRNLGTPPKISRVQTKMLHHFCMTPNLPMSAKFYGCKL